MGLDMYLGAKVYLKHPNEITDGNESFKQSYVYYGGIGYWRKAYAISQWFQNRSQWGIQNCQDVDFTIEDLFDLRKTCKDVLKSQSDDVAVGEFPGASIDEWFWQDLKTTIENIDRFERFVNLFDKEDIDDVVPVYHEWA